MPELLNTRPASAPSTDSASVAAAAAPAAAFWTLWTMHRDRLLGVCLREMNGNRADAEDALGALMLHALDKLPAYADRLARPEAWLLRMAHNLCADLRRQRVRRAQHELFTVEEPPADSDGPGANSPLSEVLGAEAHERFAHILANLPPRLRECFRLRAVAQWSHREIGAQLSLSPACVRKRVQQARDLLKGDLRHLLTERVAHRANMAPAPAELAANVAGFRLLHITLARGGQLDVPIALSSKPARARQKIATLEAYLRRHPRGMKRSALLARLLYETGRWPEAIAAYRHVVEKQPWLAEATLNLAMMLHLTGQGAAAIEVLERALRLPRPMLAYHHHFTGLLALWRGQLDAARAAFEQAVQLEPLMPLHWHALAHALWLEGDATAALRAIDAALARNPDDLVALMQSYEPLLRLEKFDDALQRLQRVLVLTHGDATARHRLAEYRQHHLSGKSAGAR